MLEWCIDKIMCCLCYGFLLLVVCYLFVLYIYSKFNIKLV